MTFSLNQIQDNIPEKFQIELLTDDSLTNGLLIANIAVTLIISFIAAIYVQKKIKEYELKAHKDKIVADRNIKFCMKVQKVFKTICSKNPNDITDEDLEKISQLKTSKNTILLDEDVISIINEFGDYIIELKMNPSSKDVKDKENYFFYKLKQNVK